MKNKIYDFFCFNIRYPAMAKYYMVRNFFYSMFGAKIHVQLFANPLMKWPVNKKCFCGSGKKFKVCHKIEIAGKIDLKDLKFIQDRLAKKRIRL